MDRPMPPDLLYQHDREPLLLVTYDRLPRTRGRVGIVTGGSCLDPPSLRLYSASCAGLTGERRAISRVDRCARESLLLRHDQNLPTDCGRSEVHPPGHREFDRRPLAQSAPELGCIPPVAASRSLSDNGCPSPAAAIPTPATSVNARIAISFTRSTACHPTWFRSTPTPDAHRPQTDIQRSAFADRAP